ncbi:uncharacterized protein LOC134282222 isoform X2 [Saccostrea cucullata]|uniref:uncharacterized protein LOC134282222 isoform X2 n=1 Tax=Saccostrea cuccullata TaxID=36930 RepID=UPI002ED1BD6A
MKIYFDRTIKPEDLKKCLHNNEEMFRKLRVLPEIERKKMYPKNKDPTSEDFDITLMYKILRNTRLVSQPNSGWGNTPQFEDQSYSDHVERVRLQRNWTQHLTDERMGNREFILRGTDLSLAILKLSDDQLMEEVMKDGYLWRTIKTTIAIEVKNEEEKSAMDAMCKRMVNTLEDCIDVFSENSTPGEVLEMLTFVENSLEIINTEHLPLISNKVEKKLEEWKRKNPPNLLMHKSCVKLYRKCYMQYACAITKASAGSIILLMRFSNLAGFMRFLEDSGNGKFASSVMCLFGSDTTFQKYQKKSTDISCHTELYVNEKENAKILLKETTARQTKGIRVSERSATIKSIPDQQCIRKPSEATAYLRFGRR